MYTQQEIEKIWRSLIPDIQQKGDKLTVKLRGQTFEVNIEKRSQVNNTRSLNYR